MLFENMRFEMKDSDIVCTNGDEYVYMTAAIYYLEPDFEYGCRDYHAVGAYVRPFTQRSLDDPDPRNRHNVDVADEEFWDDARWFGTHIGGSTAVKYEIDEYEDDYSEKFKAAEALRERIASGDVDFLNSVADQIRAKFKRRTA